MFIISIANFTVTDKRLIINSKNKIMTLKNDHSEGKVAKAIESQTSKLPSDTFLWAALGSMAVSATLKIFGKDKSALFVGQWAAPFLLLGVYNKIVKVEGHDKEHSISDYAEPDGIL
tara:strand:+ start:80982 stop:81332 length:351 start_codon:yes stop_codon:yes gene_type:complete